MPRLTAEQKADIEARYRRGATLTALGARFGRTAVGIRHVLVKAGVPMRPRGRPRRSEWLPWHKEAMAMRLAGKSSAEIGAAVGRSPAVVRTTLSQLRRGRRG